MSDNVGRRLEFVDLGRCFHLGSTRAMWRVIEIIGENVLSQMIGTPDFVVLPRDEVGQLIDDYEEYWRDIYGELYNDV